ncbi:MAG: hypothetical protein WCY32_14970 [Burkholderiaceae bacterium]
MSNAGQATTEYLIVLALVGLVLAAGPDSPLELLFEAIGDYYQRFGDQLSRP